jgi:hypothetical protein
VDHSAPTIISLAPAPSTSATTRSAIFLELHLGAIVGAVAGVIGQGVEECKDGGLTIRTKSQSAEFLCDLLFLRRYMIDAGFSNFDSLARQRGIEVLLACDTPAPTAQFLVDETMKLLGKLVVQQAN